jgi:hypothetical protein
VPAERARRAAALGALGVLVAVAPAPAQNPASDAHYCSPTGDYCIGIFVKQGVGRTLDVSGFALRGRYTLCVRRPTGHSDCRGFALKPNAAGAYASSVRWTKHFPHRARGRHRVTWRYEGATLGRVLSFTR